METDAGAVNTSRGTNGEYTPGLLGWSRKRIKNGGRRGREIDEEPEDEGEEGAAGGSKGRKRKREVERDPCTGSEPRSRLCDVHRLDIVDCFSNRTGARARVACNVTEMFQRHLLLYDSTGSLRLRSPVDYFLFSIQLEIIARAF